MISLTTPPDCASTDQLCSTVERVTGSQWLGAAANWLIAKPLSILLIVVIALVVRWLAYRLVTRIVKRAADGLFPPAVLRGRNGRDGREGRNDGAGARLLRQEALALERRQQRADTMGSVLKSITSFVIFSIVTVMVFSELGYDIGPLVTSAGVVGLAIGFGAQSLIKDFLSGMFMFFEDQYGVGDEIILGDQRGAVEALTLRITRMRAEDGTVWYVRNGEILRVGNVSQQAAGNVHDGGQPEV